jgi:hypothetical protein
MTNVIDLEEETIFINRVTAGSASRVCNATPLIYQPHRHSSKVREFHKLAAVILKHIFAGAATLCFKRHPPAGLFGEPQIFAVNKKTSVARQSSGTLKTTFKL